jgi:hypothetical protein
MVDLIIFLINSAAMFFCGVFFSEAARKNANENKARRERNQ